MRVESIYIKGFGRIVDQKFEFPSDKAILIIEDNESGKSTLAAAILAGLCGFPPRKVAGERVKLKEVYRPWNAENYGIEMIIEAGGSRFKIERDFAKGSFVVRDFETNKDISADFCSDLTGHFLGLPRDDFQRIAFISGKEVNNFSSSTNVQTRLASIVSGSKDESGADIALDNLDSARYFDDGRNVKIETAIKRLSGRIQEKKARLSELDSQLDFAGQEVQQLDQANELVRELSSQMDSLDKEYRAARFVEVRAQIEAAKNAQNDINLLQNELDSLNEYADFPEERSKQLAKAATRLTDRNLRLDESLAKSENLQKQSDAITVRLDSLQHFAIATSEDMAALAACESGIKEAQIALSRKIEELEKEKRLLKAEGIDIDASLADWQQFATLSDADISFIRSYREAQLQLKSDLQQIESQSQQAASELQLIIQNRLSRRRKGRILSGVFGTSALIFFAMMILRKLDIIPSIAGTMLSTAISAVGIVIMAKAGSLQADEKSKLERSYESAQEQSSEIVQKQKSIDSRLAQISSVIQLKNGDALIDAFRKCEASLGKCDSINTLRPQIMQSEESLESAIDRGRRQLLRFAAACGDEDILDTLANTRNSLSRYLDDRRVLENMRIDISSLAREIVSHRDSIKEEEAIIQSILSDANVDSSLQTDEAIKIFEAKSKQYQRFKEIKDSLLPAAMKQLVSEDDLLKLKIQAADIHEQIGDFSETSSPCSSSEAENARVALRKELDAANEAIMALEKSVGVCVDTYRREYPILQDEIDALEIELQKASRFGDALNIAADVLREVSQNTYRRWAGALNLRASAILSHLNPDYDNLRFDESLSFTIRHSLLDRIIEKDDIDARLSTGAKDQIYLAVKLACCEELSDAGESLPILLDDPLMAADDTRFDAGFEFIAKSLAKEHQVIILSCHKSRHERAMRDNGLEDDIEVVEIR